MKHYTKELSLFKAEDKLYSDNNSCELLIMNKIHHQRIGQLNQHQAAASNESLLPANVLYSELADRFTYDEMIALLPALTKNLIESFVKARSTRRIRGGKLSFNSVPKTKALLFDRLWSLHNAPIQSRMYQSRPIEPQRQ